ncbi:MAG: hypothetical protein ACQES4_12910 [Bacillota bacterium]
MAEQEFSKLLENNASQTLQGHSALKQAIKLHKVMDLNLSPGNVNQVIRLAERIRISSLRENEEIFDMDDNLEISAQDLVSSDFLVGKISAWIEKTREELFGAPEPPFMEDLESAVSWIETTARIDLENKNPAAASIKKEIFQIAEQQETSVPFLRRDIFIPCNDKVKSLFVQPGTLLYNLSRKVETVAEATGFSKSSVTAYILTGLEPILPRVNISLHTGSANLPNGSNNGSGKSSITLSRKSIKIEIHSADLSPQELKAIYDRYRQELKIRKSKSLSNNQVKLFYLVYNRGGPPKEGAKAFWQEIKEVWNSKPENKPYKSWEGIYQRYTLVERKMEHLFIKNNQA